jgi:hypothetical protein
MRYFFSENADRPIFVGSTRYTFEIVARIAGTSQGVLAIEDDKAAALLADAAARGIEEISAEAYAEAIEKKKRSPHSQVSVRLDPPSRATPLTLPIKGNGGVAVESGSAVPKPAAATLPPIDDTFDLSEPEPTVPAPDAPAPAPAAPKRARVKKE